MNIKPFQIEHFIIFEVRETVKATFLLLEGVKFCLFLLSSHGLQD